ncbi:MAG: diguanylate cyclase [Fimbriimonas sp.]
MERPALPNETSTRPHLPTQDGSPPALTDATVRYQAVIEAAIDCFFLLESVRDASGEIVDFRYIDMNRLGVEFLGRPREELLNATLGTTYPDGRLRPYIEKYRHVVLSGETFEQEVESRAVSGAIVTVRATPAGDGVAVSMRDVTQFRSQQRQLERQNERLRLLSAEREEVAAKASSDRQFVDAILGTMDCLVCVVDREGRFVRFNNACERLTGWTAEEICGRRVWDTIILPEERAAVMETFTRITAGQFPRSRENHWVTRTGELKLIDFRSTCLTDENGEILFVIGTGIDITRSRAVEEEVRRMNDHLELAQRIAGIGSWDVDLRTGKSQWSSQMYPLYGFDPSDTVPSLEALTGRIVGKKRDEVRLAIQNCIESRQDLDLKYRIALPNGEERVMQTLCHRIPDELRLVGTSVDVTDREKWEDEVAATMLRTVEESVHLEIQREELALMNEKLTHLATTDGLTGVANHRTFQERLDEMMLHSRRSRRPLSLVLLDVDRFKRFNDDYGHQAGDTVLRGVTAALTAVCRAGDLVARYGGEEFAVLLKDTDAATARRVAERLRLAIESHPWTHRGVTASFGISTLSESTSREMLIETADRALYASKNAGRNRFTHADDLLPIGLAIVDGCDASSLSSSPSPR